MSSPFLQLDGLAKRYGSEPVLRDLSLGVEEGEIVALLGPSGSGKTTALRLVAGFEVPDAGRVLIDGAAVESLPPARRGVGMVFQHYALFPHMTVAENIVFGLAGEPEPTVEARISELLALVDLAGLEERPVAELSGGQQQRVAVARALAPSPRVLLLDEPLSNLDPGLRERTRERLATTLREIGITTLLVTHEQQEAFELGDRIAVLHRGRVEQVGGAEDLYERPSSRFVAGFVGRAVVLSGRFVRDSGRPAVAIDDLGVTWTGELVETDAASGTGRDPEQVAPTAEGSEENLTEGEAVELVLRPDALRIAEEGERDAVSGEVVGRRYGGATSLFTVALETEQEGVEPLEIEVLCRSGELAVGDRVVVAPREGRPRGRIFRSEPHAP